MISLEKGFLGTFARGLRLLTLASFFHFAGLHNGCAAMLAVSPLQPLQSVSAAARLAQSSPRIFKSVFEPLRLGQSAVLSVARHTRSAATQAVESCKEGWSSMVSGTIGSGEPRKAAWESRFGSGDFQESWKRLDEDRGLKPVRFAPRGKLSLGERPLHPLAKVAGSDEFSKYILRKMLRSASLAGGAGSPTLALDRLSPPSPWFLNQGDFFVAASL